jgi:hypothetical protein
MMADAGLLHFLEDSIAHFRGEDDVFMDDLKQDRATSHAR